MIKWARRGDAPNLSPKPVGGDTSVHIHKIGKVNGGHETEACS